ncbi:hypothetical protein E2C01_002019 [Portunus trituberculatus]|uniref:Uncharacterized protein n=1 Tax=Portunus trituberculatus TaxID=210409 RepID=A0A5B7CJV5_PORTR|nr:hypothetical protein [Portunus trituberculatus]
MRGFPRRQEEVWECSVTCREARPVIGTAAMVIIHAYYYSGSPKVPSGLCRKYKFPPSRDPRLETHSVHINTREEHDERPSISRSFHPPEPSGQTGALDKGSEVISCRRIESSLREFQRRKLGRTATRQPSPCLPRAFPCHR